LWQLKQRLWRQMYSSGVHLSTLQVRLTLCN
jgi:hypothetical protein